MAEKIAQFRFLGYKILKSIVEIKDDPHLKTNMDIVFNNMASVDNEHNMFKFQLETNISNEDKSIMIEVTMSGLFEFDRDLNDKQKRDFFETNAPAILFPYIRAYISTITSLSGITPIVLPTINLSK